MSINLQAPIVIRREIDIFAPPNLVWDWISRVDLWPDWHPEVSSSRWLGNPGLNGRFKWRKSLLGVPSIVTRWREALEFAWSGTAWGITSHQVFLLDGDYKSTRIICEQSVEGFGARVLTPVVRHLAERWSEMWLGALKTRIEQAHERGARRPGQGPRRPRILDPSASHMVDRVRGRGRW